MRGGRIIGAMLGALILIGGYGAITGGGGGGSTLAAANLWIVPSGAGSCTRSSSTVSLASALSPTNKTCGTFSAACTAASGSAGDVVGVEDGSYTTAQNVNGCAQSSPGVTFQAQDRHLAIITQTHSLTIGDGASNVSWLTFDGIDMGSFGVAGNLNTSTQASHITVTNMKVLDHTQGGNDIIDIENVNNFTWSHSELGPVCCNNDGVYVAGSTPGNDFITLNDVYIHDIAGSTAGGAQDTSGCSAIPTSLWPTCSTDANPYVDNHFDCIQFLGVYHLTITNSKLQNCYFAGGIQNGINGGTHDLDWLISNTAIGGTGSGCNLGLTTGGPDPGPAFLSTSPVGEPDAGTAGYIRLYGVTSTCGLDLDGTTASAGMEITVVGSNFGSTSFNCTPGPGFTTFNYNLVNAACSGTGNVNGTPTFTQENPSTSSEVDYHLAGGSAGIAVVPSGISGMPTTYQDGTNRPNPSNAGAF